MARSQKTTVKRMREVLYLPENQFKSSDAVAMWLRSIDRVVEDGVLAIAVQQLLRVRGSTSWSKTTPVTGCQQWTTPDTNQAALNRLKTCSTYSRKVVVSPCTLVRVLGFARPVHLQKTFANA